MAQTDRDVLVALYDATDGDHWRRKKNWKTGAALSEWYGVKVNSEGRVVELSLQANNLTAHHFPHVPRWRAVVGCHVLSVFSSKGHIPASLGQLSNLKELILSLNYLSGPIPPELGKLGALKTLELCVNKLDGNIPPELGDLRQLQTLHVNSNRLTGTIPEALGKLTALQALFLHRNKLSGSIPPELGNLTKLKQLWLRSNELTGPISVELGRLALLEYLSLGENELSGEIPALLGQLRNLQVLSLHNNKLTGTIPEALGKLTALQALFLHRNKLSGPIPKELGDLAELKKLMLHHNKLTVLPRAMAVKLAALKPPITVELDNNPWEEPPPEVVTRGITFAAQYLKDLDDYGRTSSNRLKVVLVGLGNAGKTSVAIRLQGGNPSNKLPIPEERTVGVEIRDMKLGVGQGNEGSRVRPELDVKIWDFAGQKAYYDTHQMFLTPDALFILVVDMFAYSDVNSSKDALERWLDILQARVPGSVVLMVGTHSDSFASSAIRSERIQSFKKDVRDVTERIGRDCHKLNESRRRGHEDGWQDNSHHDCRPIRVVDETVAFNLCSSQQEDIDALRALVERVAYGVHEGYRFPSVRRNDVPKTHALAVATLEAVRRGVDVAGSAGDQKEVLRRLSQGDPRKGMPFIKFSDAVALYIDLWDIQDKQESLLSVLPSVLMALSFTRTRGAKATPTRAELEQAFLRAVQLHQDRGAIVLTGVDAGGQGGHGRDAGAGAPAANIVIHVNPAWIAVLVRRVVDIRLLDPAQQGSVLEALKGSTPESSVLALATQQHRFFQAGEASRDYLKFLWLRDMKLGPASTQTPPLKMSEDDVDVMIDSLLDMRFMFRVKDEHRGEKLDLYTVASCLPDHAGYDVDPAKMLELDVGGAIFSQELEVLGTHVVPPGLIPAAGMVRARSRAYPGVLEARSLFRVQQSLNSRV
ncbi:unnamed protein product [Ectocarpus sp. 8 AP-2014]